MFSFEHNFLIKSVIFAALNQMTINDTHPQPVNIKFCRCTITKGHLFAKVISVCLFIFMTLFDEIYQLTQRKLNLVITFPKCRTMFRNNLLDAFEEIKVHLRVLFYGYVWLACHLSWRRCSPILLCYIGGQLLAVCQAPKVDK